MTLLITVFAAVIVTVLWYMRKDDSMKLEPLMFMFWGASIMWFVDAVVEFIELRDAYFTPAIEDMVNDSFLGFSVIALALIIWLVILMVKDPKGTVRAALHRNSR